MSRARVCTSKKKKRTKKKLVKNKGPLGTGSGLDPGTFNGYWKKKKEKVSFPGTFVRGVETRRRGHGTIKPEGGLSRIYGGGGKSTGARPCAGSNPTKRADNLRPS